MVELPSPFDVEQLRGQAKELRRAFAGGDGGARERVRRSHPRFGAARPEDADLAGFTLRDAQLCVARELGFDGWRDVLAHAQAPGSVDRPWRRWSDSPSWDMRERARAAALLTGAAHIGEEHALGALLQPPRRTDAVEVLEALGATWSKWEQLHASISSKHPERRGMTMSPAWYGFIAFAEGLALADGADRVSDEHALLTLAYRRTAQYPGTLEQFQVDPEQAAIALAKRGIAVTDLRPPAKAAIHGRTGPRVHFDFKDFAAVTLAMSTRFKGLGYWGWNTDGSGDYWVDGEAHLDVEGLVREVAESGNAIWTDHHPNK
jgi:hypothetical protein